MEFFKILKKKKFNQVIRQYIRCHVLFFAIFQTLLNGFSRKSMEITRQAINNKILKKLRSKNKKFIKQFVEKNDFKDKPHEISNKIWVAWFQGEENAPILVKKCLESIRSNFPDREVVILTEDNFKEYVDIPEYILNKLKKGYITYTHFSDILRLELLSKYGGTWIDATVLITSKDVPKFIMNSDLFMYQILKPGLDGHPTRISSWFMTASTNNCIIELTRALLYRYWKKKKFLMDYFLIHDFIELAIERYPEEWNKVVPVSSEIPHILLMHINETFEEGLWENINLLTPIHKLSYKICDEEKENTFYKKIID